MGNGGRVDLPTEAVGEGKAWRKTPGVLGIERNLVKAVAHLGDGSLGTQRLRLARKSPTESANTLK